MSEIIDMRAFCEALYCAYAPTDAFTIGPDARIAFRAKVTENGRTTERHVEFLAVHSLTRQREQPASWRPGDRLELSVIELERPPGSEWRVWLNPWHLEEIEFRCAGMRLDGTEVGGVGRWLQDELPRRGAG